MKFEAPLNGILGFLDFFDDDLTKDDRRQFIAIMRKSAERLLNTLDSIIEMSKLESGIIEMNKYVFNFNEALNEFNQKIKYNYSNPDVEYICTIETYGDQILIEADRLKMFRILQALIDNAYKFTKKGFVKLTVKSEKDTLILEVEDTGIGIKNKDKEAIFEPFRQADFDLNRKYEGNGLGLTISKHLIHLMGGEINSESHEHKGARFICKIPGIILSKKTSDEKKIPNVNRAITGKKIFAKEENTDFLLFKMVPAKAGC